MRDLDGQGAEGRRLWVPKHGVGSCDEWYLQAEEAGKLSSKPEIGAAVLYTNWQKMGPGRFNGRLDIVHIGLVLRVTPVEQSIEGNTTLGKYDRNGYTQTHKEVDKKRVAGYVLP